jgi:short-subunit dehydrogenase
MKSLAKYRAASPILLFLAALLLNSCVTAKLSRSQEKKITGKTYVIIGASSGFGRGVAEELGRCGANVVIAARRTELLEEVADTIRKAGGTATVVTMDISRPEDMQRLTDTVLKLYDTVDVWINMVGVGAIGKFWEIPVEDQARLVDVNLKGFIYGTYAAIGQFRKQGYGTLINMGSVDSETPHAYQATYAATKAAVMSLGIALAQELRLEGLRDIKVVTIEPWAVDTPFWRHAANYSGGTPRFAALDEPQKVVNAVLRTSLNPRKKEVPVGWKATGSSISHHHFPRLTERITANVAHTYQIENAPPYPDTVGAIYQPMEGGRGVEDGVKERIKREKKQMKEDKKAARRGRKEGSRKEE